MSYESNFYKTGNVMGLEYYRTVKQFAARNIAGAKDIYKDLAARFPHRKKKKPVPPAADGLDAAMKKVA